MNQTIPKDLQMTSKDLKWSQKTPLKTINLFLKKVKTKNKSKGGDPIDVSPSHGKDLFEQAFVLQKMAEFKQNLKKD